MKIHYKFAALLLALPILFSASCETDSTPDVSPSISVSPEAAQVTGTQVTGTQVKLPGGLYPDREYTVRPAAPLLTDRDGNEAKRLNGEYNYEFKPGRYELGAGGEIYPFHIAYNSPFAISYLYGFCDGAGIIICEPVFSEVQLVGYGDRSYYAAVVYDEVAYEPEYSVSSHAYIIETDGSAVYEYDNVHYIMSGDRLYLKKDGKWGAVSYSLEEIIPFEYNFYPVFYEGLSLQFDESRTVYYYIDESGDIALGPYFAVHGTANSY